MKSESGVFGRGRKEGVQGRHQKVYPGKKKRGIRQRAARTRASFKGNEKRGRRKKNVKKVPMIEKAASFEKDFGGFVPVFKKVYFCRRGGWLLTNKWIRRKGVKVLNKNSRGPEELACNLTKKKREIVELVKNERKEGTQTGPSKREKRGYFAGGTYEGRTGPERKKTNDQNFWK